MRLIPKQFGPKTVRTENNSCPGQFVPKSTCTQDNLSPRKAHPANALNIKLDILNEALQHGFDVVPVISRCDAQAALTLHQQEDHYNGIGPIFGVDARSPCEPRCDAAIPIRPHVTNGADHDGPNPTVSSTLDCHFSSQDDPSPDTTTHNARRTYSAEFMRDINHSNICPLKRQTRKRLFKYRLWYDNVKHGGFSVDTHSRCFDPEPISVRINSDHHISNKNKFKCLDLRCWLEWKQTTVPMLHSKYLIFAVPYLMWDHWKINVMLYLSTSVTIALTSFVWLNQGSMITSLIYCVWSAIPSGYSFISVPRKSGRGGGLMLAYKSTIRMRL